MMPDPFQYVGRVVERDETGKVRKLEVIHQMDTIELSADPDENEFVTFVTVVDLGRKPE